MKIRKSCSQTLNSWVVSYKHTFLGSFMNCYTRFWNNYPRIGKRFHIRDLDAWQRGWILTGSHFSRSSFTFVEVKATINVWIILFFLLHSHIEMANFLKWFKTSSESDFLSQKSRWNKLGIRVMRDSWFDCEFLYDSHRCGSIGHRGKPNPIEV